MPDQPNETAKPGPKPPSFVHNRLAEALKALRGAPRNIWTHLLEQQISVALGTARVIAGASPAPKSPTEATASAAGESSSTGS